MNLNKLKKIVSGIAFACLLAACGGTEPPLENGDSVMQVTEADGRKGVSTLTRKARLHKSRLDFSDRFYLPGPTHLPKQEVWRVVTDSFDNSTLFYNITMGEPGWLQRQVWYTYNSEHGRLEYSLWDPVTGFSWLYMSPGGTHVEYQVLWTMFEPAHMIADADFVNYMMNFFQDPPLPPNWTWTDYDYTNTGLITPGDDTPAPAEGTGESATSVGADGTWSDAWWHQIPCSWRIDPTYQRPGGTDMTLMRGKKTP